MLLFSCILIIKKYEELIYEEMEDSFKFNQYFKKNKIFWKNRVKKKKERKKEEKKRLP